MVVLSVENGKRPHEGHWSACDVGNPNVSKLYVMAFSNCFSFSGSSLPACKSLRRRNANMMPEQLSLVLDLEPSWQHYITLHGGVALPSDSLSLYHDPATPLAVASVLRRCLDVACEIRKALRAEVDESCDTLSIRYGSWCAFTGGHSLVKALLVNDHVDSSMADSVHSLLEHYSRSLRSALLRACPESVAVLLAEALHGDDSNLWGKLVAMACSAEMGCKSVAFSGPVGCGKSFTIVAFMALLSLVSNASMAVLMDSNDPLDDTVRFAWSQLSGLVKIVRLAGSNHFDHLSEKISSAGKRPWHSALREARTCLSQEELLGPCLVFSTVELVSKTLSGRCVVPSGSFHFVVTDEGQKQRHGMMLPALHICKRESVICLYYDLKQTPPYQSPHARGTTLGMLQNQFATGVWNLPFATARPLDAWLSALRDIQPALDSPPGDISSLERDSEHVQVANSSFLGGCLKISQAYGMESCDLPVLAFVECQRLPEEASVIIGEFLYPDLLPAFEDVLSPGPLPAGAAARCRARPAPWLPPYIVVKGIPQCPRDGDGVALPHVEGIAATFALARAYLQNYPQTCVSHPVGILFGHYVSWEAAQWQLLEMQDQALRHYEQRYLETHGGNIASAVPDLEDVSFEVARGFFGDELWPLYVKCIKGETAQSMNVKCCIVDLCSWNGRFTAKFWRVLVWLTRFTHCCFILGWFAHGGIDGVSPELFDFLVSDLSWDVFSSASPWSTWAAEVLLLATQKTYLSRADVYAKLQDRKRVKGISLLTDIRLELGIRQAQSCFPWKPEDALPDLRAAVFGNVAEVVADPDVVHADPQWRLFLPDQEVCRCSVTNFCDRFFCWFYAF